MKGREARGPIFSLRRVFPGPGLPLETHVVKQGLRVGKVPLRKVSGSQTP